MLGVALIAFVAGLLVDGLVDFPLLTPRLVGTFTLVLALADASATCTGANRYTPCAACYPVESPGLPQEKAGNDCDAALFLRARGQFSQCYGALGKFLIE